MKALFSRLTNFKKECPVCNSTGKIVCNCNDNKELSCPNCKGNGVVSVRKTTSQTYEVPCDYPGCRHGKVQCGVCSGTGKNADGTPCTTCRGTGKVNCRVCNGVGKVKRVKQESWLEHETCHICNGRGMVACYQCHGSKERVCPECKGKGEVLNVGKIVLMAVVALAVIAMPVMVAAVALLALGYCLFQLEEKNDANTKVESDHKSETSAAKMTAEQKIEYEEID